MKKLIKKSLIFTIIAVMLMQSFVFTGFAANEPVSATYNATIMSAKGGAKSIATLTFDDGVHATNQILRPLMQEYGLVSSLMVVPSRIEGVPPYSKGYSTVSELNALAEEGKYFDILSHSYSHMYMHDTGKNAENNTESNIANEILGSKTYLEKKFPWQDSLAMAVPGGSYSTDAIAAMMNCFYAARMGNSGASTTNMQTLDPADTSTDGGWYALSNMWLKDAGVSGGSLLSYLDHCVQYGGWFFTGCHNVVTDASTLGGNNDITVEKLRVLLAKLNEYQTSGLLWVASFSDATKYIRERQNSTVSQYSTADGMFVEVTMADKTARGQALSSDVFDMPLTVKVEIPEGWASVRLRQNGKETIVSSFTEGSKTYAYAEIVPNSGRVSITNAEEEIPTSAVNAVLTPAKGGATSIASMTFDDGLVKTAEALNELCAKYDCKASLMIISNRINATNISFWNEILSKGYLTIGSHSANHNYIVHPSSKDYVAANNTPEAIYTEIAGSLQTLNRWFPDQNVLTFAIPYSTYVDDAYACLKEHFYSVRSGRCVLVDSSAAGKMQSLDPTPGSHSIGGWYSPIGIRMMPEKSSVKGYEALTVDNICSYLDKCVRDGGWFISAAHGIVEGENMDITIDDISTIMAKMQYYQNQGKLWVASYEEATMYVRERQNASVKAYSTFDGMYVDLTMADTTADGLPLNSDVFNMPLTVKVEVPKTYGRIQYTQNGKTYTTYCKAENGSRFAYIDLVPNGGIASITNVGDPTEYVMNLGMKQSVAARESLTYNLYIPTDSYVEKVFDGLNLLTGEVMDNGMTKYSVGDIQIQDVNRVHEFRLVFKESTGYAEYEFDNSVVSYFEALTESDAATTGDKQLAYDFLVYAKECIKRYKPEELTDKIEELIAELEGMGYSSTKAPDVTADLGTLTKVLNGAALTLNEKPYYIFYVNEGFTGRITFSYGNSETAFEVINGYYHCKLYVIYEVENVHDLANDIIIKAEEKKGTSYTLIAEGSYSLGMFVEGISDGGVAPAYASALHSYVTAAHNYKSADQ